MTSTAEVELQRKQLLGSSLKKNGPDDSGNSHERGSIDAAGEEVPLSKGKRMKPRVVLFGTDLSNYSPTTQFFCCTVGVFSFNVLYGYLQELLSVHIAGRKLALFLAVCQFSGYAFWSTILARLNRDIFRANKTTDTAGTMTEASDSSSDDEDGDGADYKDNNQKMKQTPMLQGSTGRFIGLALLRAFDLAVTNSAMRYINYPAKTLIKSCRVVFTMMIGLAIGRKRYLVRDYVAVFTLVIGLLIFLHADSNSSAVFHPLGVILLCISLVCDGTLNNWSELMMETHSMSQDEFHSHLYVVSLMATVVAAFAHRELWEGIQYFLLQAGTVTEIDNNETPTWSITEKVLVLVLFSTSGIMGASCLGAITKRFGALIMSLTSTARKATTLFLSFFLFDNNCTPEHVLGVTLFMGALLLKAVGKANGGGLPPSASSPSSSSSAPPSSKQTYDGMKRDLSAAQLNQPAGEEPEEDPSSSSYLLSPTKSTKTDWWRHLKIVQRFLLGEGSSSVGHSTADDGGMTRISAGPGVSRILRHRSSIDMGDAVPTD